MPSVQRLPHHLRVVAPRPRRITAALAIPGLTAAVLASAVFTGCGTSGRVVEVPAAGALAIPAFVTVPADLARSPQLRALVPRDTAGLEPTAERANGELLVDALAALATLPDAPTRVSRIGIYNNSVNITYEQNGVAGRAVTVSYQPGSALYVGEPSFSDDPTYDLAAVDPAVPAAVIAAIEARVPNARVTRLDLSIGLSYGFGLVWYLDVEDARGSLANVFADLDGAIVAVDMD
jgi:hypothetical protein